MVCKNRANDHTDLGASACMCILPKLSILCPIFRGPRPTHQFHCFNWRSHAPFFWIRILAGARSKSAVALPQSSHFHIRSAPQPFAQWPDDASSVDAALRGMREELHVDVTKDTEGLVPCHSSDRTIPIRRSLDSPILLDVLVWLNLGAFSTRRHLHPG